MYLSEDMALSSWTQEATLIVLLTISVIYLYSFVLQFQEDIDSQSIINRMFERMRPNDVNLGSEPGHYVSTFYFGTALVLPFPVLTVGIVGAGQLFPIPEIIAIIWGLGSVVEQYSRIEIKGWFPKQDRLDIEGRIFSIIINIYRSAKGLSTTQIVLLGLVSNIPILTIGLRTFINYLQTFTLGEPMQMWTELGLVTTFFGSFLFSSWFWLREMGRIPHFIKEWEKKHSETPTLSEMDLGPPRTRPVGVLMPFLLVMTISSIYSAMQRLDYYFGHGESLTALFAILWPVLAVSLYYCSKITQAKNSQPVNTESYVLPVALIVNWVGIYAIDAIPYVVSVLWLDFTYRPDHGGAIGVILAVMLFFYWNPDVESRLSKEHSWRKHASAISLILFGIGFMILWYLSAIPDIRFVTLLIGIVAIAGGIAGMFEYKLVFS
ncbi:hypothetical protein [Halosimplex carlsbadense]|uniref:hypothetical protein n=1 Tax=Halosimplex carlsbadense TaxID=171164 RepID=UPI00195536E9|nr:hypothetical protein [Halosimplex carlsbadense]